MSESTNKFLSSLGSGREERPAAGADVVAHGSDQLAQECARAICNQWHIGDFVGDEGDWIDATVDQVAERLKHILESNHASKA